MPSKKLAKRIKATTFLTAEQTSNFTWLISDQNGDAVGRYSTQFENLTFFEDGVMSFNECMELPELLKRIHA